MRLHRSFHTTTHRVIHSTHTEFAGLRGPVIHSFVRDVLPSGAQGRQTEDVNFFGASSTNAIIIIS